MKELKISVLLNTAALVALRNEQTILNNFVQLKVNNKMFICVATNGNITASKNVVEFKEVISSTNFKKL